MNYFNDELFKNKTAQELPDHGLYLVNSNTGTGKTYHTIEGMVQLAHSEGKRRLQIFCTTQWKYIPQEWIKNAYSKAGIYHLHEKEVLVIKSLVDAVVDNWEKCIIPEDLRGTKQYKDLDAFIKLYPKKINPVVKTSIQNDLENKIRAFRTETTSWLEKKYPKEQERINAIRPGQAAEWAGKLFPVSRCTDSEVRIICLTAQMLLLGSKSVVTARRIRFIPDLIKGAILYLDEIDSVKEIFSSHLINETCKNQYDLAHAVSNAAKWLQAHDWPTDLLEDSTWFKEHGKKSIQEKMKELNDLINKTDKTWGLKRNFKFEAVEDKSRFLFNEFKHNHMVGTLRFAVESREDKVNYIVPLKESTEAKEKKEGSLPDNSIGRMIQDFSNVMWNLTWYCKRLASNAANKTWDFYAPEFTQVFFAKLSSVFSQFNFLPAEREAILSRIEKDGKKWNKTAADDAKKDKLHPLHDKGFNLVDFKDSPEHEYQTQISSYSLSMTADAILYALVSQCFVVGLSATATMPTIIGNFDLAYLEGKPDITVFKPTPEDLENKKNEYHALIEHNAQDMQINFIQPLGAIGSEKYIESWTPFCQGDSIAARMLWNRIDIACKQNSKSDVEFILERYHRLFTVMHNFAGEKNNRAMLAVFNKGLKEHDGEFDFNIAVDMAKASGFQTIAEILNGQDDKEKPVFTRLSGEDFDQNSKIIKEKLHEGYRILVASTYGTIGKGVNLDYTCNEQLATILLSEARQSTTCDFNGIHLDYPTNLVPQVSSLIEDTFEKSIESLLKRCLNLMYLFNSGELSWSETRLEIENSFNVYSSGFSGKKQVETKDKRSVRYFALTKIIQALGRLYRSPRKQPQLFISLEDRVRNLIQSTRLPSDMLPLPAYSAIQEKIFADHISPISEAQLKKIETACNLSNNLMLGLVEAIYQEKADIQTIETWKALREEALTALIKKNHCERPQEVANYFFDTQPFTDKALDNYWYYTDNDYHTVEMSFLPDKPAPEYHYIDVDAGDLPKLMQIDLLKQGFIKRGWATQLEKGFSLPSPAFYNNIFKGALGEAVLTIVLNDVLKIPLQHIALEHYERFDLLVSGGVYLDSKYWRYQKEINTDEQQKKYLERLTECKGTHAILVQTAVVELDTRWQPQDSIDKERLTIIPALLTCTKTKTKTVYDINPAALSVLHSKILKYQ